MVEALLSFPVIIEVPIAWGEMDAMGHVNNIVYFRYFESARIAYFNKLEISNIALKTGFGPILSDTHCRYRVPLSYPDTIAVGAKVTKMGEDRFIMKYLIFSHKHQKIAAEGEGTIVSFDYGQNKKVPIPDEIKKRILALEKTEQL